MTARPAPGPHTHCMLGDSCTCAPIEVRGCRYATFANRDPLGVYCPPPSRTYLRPDWRAQAVLAGLAIIVLALVAALSWGLMDLAASVFNG